MSSYPVYPHGFYGNMMTSAPPVIPQVPPGVSVTQLGLRPGQHHVGLQMTHQGLLAPGSGDGSQMGHPSVLQPGGHSMPQTSQGISGTPAWCYLDLPPPMSSAQMVPIQHMEKDSNKYHFGITNTESHHLHMQKDAIDYAANAGLATGGGMPNMNHPHLTMALENAPHTSGASLPPQEPAIEQPPAPKPATPRKVKPKSTGRSTSAKKRQRKPELWKKNVSKFKKIRGEAHISRNGTFIPAKGVETIDCASCSFKCNENFSDELRGQLFTMFYSLGTNESQKQFVCQNVTEESTKQTNKTSEDGSAVENRRKVTRKYYLPESDNTRRQVCSRFFRGTLSVGKSFITHALKHKMFGCYIGQEKRGKPHNKTPQPLVEKARTHIESVLFSECKGTKKKSVKKKCAEKGLTVAKMYDLFKADCEGRNELPVSLSIYRRVFHTEF